MSIEKEFDGLDPKQKRKVTWSTLAKKRFDDLDPKQKKTVIWSVLVVFILVGCLFGYNARTEKVQRILGNNGSKEIKLDPDMIQKTLLREQRRELDAMHTAIKVLQNEQKQGRGGQTQDSQANIKELEKPQTTKLPEVPDADRIAAGKSDAIAGTGEEVEWPKPLDANGRPIVDDAKSPRHGITAPPVPRGNAQPEKEELIGDIGFLSNSNKTEEVDAKKKGRTVYLPPSFMEAALLTGFDASTSGKGKNNPEPLLLRIQTPAVLPNDIKANLAGCFVMAEAVGRLDKERADVRLNSLSCLSKEGNAIIDTPVKGFVTDSDSKVGLSGRVVSRMGAATARAVVAGFFGGVGDALKASSTTQSSSALGATSWVDTSQVSKYALGGGFSQGADTLADFYLTLAKQTTPVIEVGATKKITVIISEGKELEIREIANNETL